MTRGQYWDRIAADWLDGRDRLWRAHSDSVNVALCYRWLSGRPARRLLKTDLFDETAGVGLWPDLVTLAAKVVAVDVSQGVATRARMRHPIQALAADVRHLPFQDGTFDTVVSNSTLDHFDRPQAIAEGLRELRRVLEPSGRLLLTLDNAANPIVAIRNVLPQGWLSRLGLVPYEMGRTLTPKAAHHLLTELGFSVVRQTTIMHAPRVAAIPLLRMVDSGRRAPSDSPWLRVLKRFETAERWPIRSVTGHFLAVLAVKT